MVALLGWVLLAGPEARATVFNAVQYLEPGQSALGIEPEFVLSSGSGFGASFRYSLGLNDLSNASFLIGTGSGPRQFRFGGNYTFDVFPDDENQAGMGVALQATYARVGMQSAGTGVTEPASGTQARFETLLLPYIHNRFSSAGGDVEPFFSFPFGFSLRDGHFQLSSAVAVGSFFHRSPRVAYSMELNVGVNNAETILAGGVLYFFD